MTVQRLRIGDFVDFIDKPSASPARLVAAGPVLWHIVLIEPQQEVTTVWRLHELGMEMYSPIVRRKVRTNRRTASGQREMRVAPRPMFPGYSFLSTAATPDLNIVRRVNGVRDFLNVEGKPAVLPQAAIDAIRAKEFDQHQKYMEEISPRRKRPHLKRGQSVRIENGPFADFVRTIEQVDSLGRIMVLHGMVKHWMEADQVVLADSV